MIIMLYETCSLRFVFFGGGEGFVEDILKGETNKYWEYCQLLISWVCCCV
jgi:hypothetical protein